MSIISVIGLNSFARLACLSSKLFLASLVLSASLWSRASRAKTETGHALAAWNGHHSPPRKRTPIHESLATRAGRVKAIERICERAFSGHRGRLDGVRQGERLCASQRHGMYSSWVNVLLASGTSSTASNFTRNTFCANLQRLRQISISTTAVPCDLVTIFCQATASSSPHQTTSSTFASSQFPVSPPSLAINVRLNQT